MKIVSAIISLLVSVQVFAGINEDFRALKDSGVDYQVIGTVCEEVTRLRFEEEYGNKYVVVTGIEYGDSNRVIGELDAVVFDKATQKVVRVAEVKCWKDFKGALAKARDQRQRFLSNIESGKTLFFHSKHSEYSFKKENFAGNKTFLTVSQKGSKAAGFDIELSYELKELMQLRQMMIDCQKSHQCKAAE